MPAIKSQSVKNLTVRFIRIGPGLGARNKYLILSFALFANGLFAAEERPPNIVFFFADDQTSDSLACYGNPIVQTPNIDRLAERGTLFQNAFVNQAICWVSRTNILFWKMACEDAEGLRACGSLRRV